MKLNKVYHIKFEENTLPDKCANVILADPPYFETKGEFDFIWDSFEDYLKDVEKWAIECKRILADNGTLFWYGSSKKIAYAQIIFDKYFELLSSVTIHISDRQTNKIKINDARSFINTSERILMYGNGDDYHDSIRKAIKQTQKYLLTITDRKSLANNMVKNGICKNIKSAISNSNNILNQKSSKPQLITEKQYNLIDSLDKKEYYILKKEFDDYKIKYDNERRFFNPIEQHKMDVLKFSQEGYITGKYDHETVKPEQLTRMLINTCSRKDDLIVVPFSGSGTECSMAKKEGRNFIGFDIEQKYVDMSNKRCNNQSQLTMF